MTLARVMAMVTAMLLSGGCGPIELPDQLGLQAISPDGRLIAREWCVDGCDVPQSRTITVSAAPSAPSGRLPAGDAALRVWIAEHDDARLAMRWTAERALRIEGDCLSDSNYRPLPPQKFKGVTLAFVRSPTQIRCEEPL